MSERRRSADPRRTAVRILDRVERGGAFASALLEHEAARFEDRRDAALLNELVLGVLRTQSILDDVLGRVASRPSAAMDPELRHVLRIGAYSLLFLDRVPSFAAVDTAVRMARETKRAFGAGFVNAVLRRIADGGRELLPPEPVPSDLDGLARFTSHPAWWVRKTVARLGWERAARLASANNHPAPTVIRTKRSRTGTEALAARLEQEGIEVERCRFVPDGLRVRAGLPIASSAFRDGWFFVQDEASQLAGLLAAGIRGRRAADLCAAPGGKSLTIADELPEGGVVIALDRHAGRLARLRANLRRLREDRILPLVADCTNRPPLRPPFDPVLVDAPCSGTGTLRRHPEIRWRLRAEDLPALARRQGLLLDSAATLVEPGGTIVYSVCSLEPEEGEDVVAAFLGRSNGFELVDPRPLLPPPAASVVGDDGALRTSPDQDGLDGFYAAVLRRRS